MLPSQPPSAGVAAASLREGSTGWGVYALQSALTDAAGASLSLDGHFGAKTQSALAEFQNRNRLAVDGVCGPATRRLLADAVCRRIDRSLPVPQGLSRGMARGEGGDNGAAVNWSVAGGVDVGLWQHRVYGPPYSMAALKAAFLPYRSGITAMRSFLDARLRFTGRAWVGHSRERAGRCALLAHNWPVAAERVADTGRCSSPDARCTWVPRDDLGRSLVKFPDGTRVETRQQWCEFYALGGPHGAGAIASAVTAW